MAGDQQGVIGVVGGTGPLGKGLALRFARAGRHVVVGSRTRERGEEVAAWVRGRADGATVEGTTNADACERAEVVVLAIPYDGIDATLPPLVDAIGDKVVVCCVNQIGFDREGPFELHDGRPSSAQQTQGHLPSARVVGAFHHVAAGALAKDEAVEVDVLLAADDEDAMAVAVDLVELVPGMRPVTVGALRLAAPLEHFTAVLVAVNKRHKVRAGIKLVGLVREGD